MILILYATLFSSYIFCIYLCSSVDQPTQLEIPDIEGNSLKTAPDVVSSLKQLKMNRCGISSLPERFAVCHMFITTSQHHYYLHYILFMQTLQNIK